MGRCKEYDRAIERVFELVYVWVDAYEYCEQYGVEGFIEFPGFYNEPYIPFSAGKGVSGYSGMVEQEIQMWENNRRSYSQRYVDWLKCQTFEIVPCSSSPDYQVYVVTERFYDDVINWNNTHFRVQDIDLRYTKDSIECLIEIMEQYLADI